MRDLLPGATPHILQARAQILASIRVFFADLGVTEVDVPVIGCSTVTEPNIDSLQVRSAHSACDGFYLQTSPEYAMKRLLAAGSGPIYYLGKAFRDESAGSRHNPEFTLLEWYRPGWNHRQLMREVVQLVQQFLPGDVQFMTYSEAFRTHVGIDPLEAGIDELQALGMDRTGASFDDDNRNVWLELLFSHCVEPALHGITLIDEYPASQAALAKLGNNDQGQPVAQRFELFVDGVELANGYTELTDAGEQRKRFAADNARRKLCGQPEIPVDEALLAALESGLPECAGVALGVDRLVMLALGRNDIGDVLPLRHA